MVLCVAVFLWWSSAGLLCFYFFCDERKWSKSKLIMIWMNFSLSPRVFIDAFFMVIHNKNKKKNCNVCERRSIMKKFYPNYRDTCQRAIKMFIQKFFFSFNFFSQPVFFMRSTIVSITNSSSHDKNICESTHAWQHVIVIELKKFKFFHIESESNA